MLKLDLNRLDREGSARVEGDVAADDPLWEGSGLAFEGPLRVRLRAQVSGSDEVVIRGTLEGVQLRECRRCLDPVEVEVEEEVTLVYAPSDALSDRTDPEIREIPAGVDELDLTEAIREELILGVPSFVVCSPDCKGLCPQCGVKLDEETCTCTTDEADPRWDALRALRNE